MFDLDLTMIMIYDYSTKISHFFVIMKQQLVPWSYHVKCMCHVYNLLKIEPVWEKALLFSWSYHVKYLYFTLFLQSINETENRIICTNFRQKIKKIREFSVHFLQFPSVSSKFSNISWICSNFPKFYLPINLLKIS